MSDINSNGISNDSLKSSHTLDTSNLAQIDTNLRSHREHLKFDNTYDDSAASTPKLSPVLDSAGNFSPSTDTSTVSTPTSVISPLFNGHGHERTLHRRTTSSSSTSSLSNGFALSSGAEHPTSKLKKSIEIKSEPIISTISEEKYKDEKISTTKKKHHIRYRFRNLSHQSQASILDAEASRSSTFFGFYTLFWVTIAFLIIRGTIYNYLRNSQFLGTNIVNILRRDLFKIALTDLALYLGTYFVFFWQLGVKHGILDWNKTGWIIQHIWQASYLGFVLWFNEYMEYPWIGCVYLLLHSLVLLMKQHSYAFYNGHFWCIKEELKHSQKRLKELEQLLSSSTDQQDQETLTNISEEIAYFNSQIEFCSKEIRMQSEKTEFPSNINLSNFFDYSMFPTLVYQIEYPRNEKIRWSYVLEKVLATFGVFLLLIIVAENYLYPIAMRAIALRDTTLNEKILQYPIILLDLVPPFILIYLLVFYIIWDAILNGIAELTRFADRQFYGEWWNCVTWDQFAKDWNTPVHRFLLRHVYHSSISSFHISKQQATRK